MRKSGDMIRDQVRILYLLFLWLIAAEGSTLFFTSPFPVRELYAAEKSILGCLYHRYNISMVCTYIRIQIYDVF